MATDFATLVRNVVKETSMAQPNPTSLRSIFAKHVSLNEIDEDELLDGKAKPVKNETLKRLGLDDPREILLCLPQSYANTKKSLFIIPQEDDEERKLYNLRHTGELIGFDKNKKMVDLSNNSGWARTFRLKIGLADDEGNLVSYSVFGNPWPYRNLVKDECLNLVGKVVYMGFGAKTQAYLQDVEIPPSHAIGKVWVKYNGIQGRVAGEKVEALVREQLGNPDAYQHCATKLIGGLGMSAQEALKAAQLDDTYDSFERLIQVLHQPFEVNDGIFAKLASHKLSAMAVQAAALRHNTRHSHPDAPISVDVAQIDKLIKLQKEKLTQGQISVARDLVKLLREPKPMNTLFSGDVGTGKTIPFLLAAVAAHQAGAKVSIIAPTSILADQIAKQVVLRFSDQIKGVERIVAGGKILDHHSILVGTPGITSVASKAKYSPDFLICDEQHKLPTAVREKMVKPWTHTLEVSATPIPRSLASALFGGKTILNLRESPVKKTYNCVVGDVSMRPQFANEIKKSLDRGERAVVIYPRVNAMIVDEVQDEGEIIQREKKSVLSGAEALEKSFPGKVAIIHGGMKDEDIAQAIEDVRSGKKPLVVASTVIETGVDIPGITCMIVRDADYFGISQLHQLRGRLVRHGGEGFFGMMVHSMEELSEDTYARLDAIKNSVDGYHLSEVDLVQRGFGLLGGEAQSGALSSEGIFRLVKLRPEDFLRKKLSVESLQDNSVNLSEQRSRENSESKENQIIRMQPRLFG